MSEVESPEVLEVGMMLVTDVKTDETLDGVSDPPVLTSVGNVTLPE